MGLMENGGGGLSIADAMALANGNNGGFGGSGGVFIAILFLFFILSRGNGLFGGNGGFSNSPAAQGAITRAEMMDGFNFNQIENGIRGLERGLCDGFYSQNTTMLQGFNTIGRAIDQARFDAQACCWNFMAA